jgi:predicted enzyme related to lactoylglutathione lyase
MARKAFAVATALIAGLLWAPSLRAEDAAPAPVADDPGLKLTNVVVYVDDQDEALRWYTEKLGLEKRVDQKFGEGQRWLTVAAKGTDLELTLQKAKAGAKQTLGADNRWVFSAKDCQKTYETLKARGVNFLSPPKSQPWGVQGVFQDPFGNEFFLVCPPQG